MILLLWRELTESTSVLLERFWGRFSLADFYYFYVVRENGPGWIGYVILIGWKYATTITVKLFTRQTKIRSSFCYKSFASEWRCGVPDIRYITLIVTERKLISFWSGFSRMFLFCVFSWLIEKYKNVTLMLMRFWSEISRMFLCMFLGLIILRLKMCILQTQRSRAVAK